MMHLKINYQMILCGHDAATTPVVLTSFEQRESAATTFRTSGTFLGKSLECSCCIWQLFPNRLSERCSGLPRMAVGEAHARRQTFVYRQQKSTVVFI